MDRPHSYQIIYYFDTPAFGIKYQLFDRVKNHIEYAHFPMQ
jgi:hypothetical protein